MDKHEDNIGSDTWHSASKQSDLRSPRSDQTMYNGHLNNGGYTMPDSLEEEQELAHKQHGQLMVGASNQRLHTKQNQKTKEGLSALEHKAAEIIDDKFIRKKDQLIHLRNFAKSSNITIRDPELRRELEDARRALAGTSGSVGKRPLNFRPTPWMLNSLFIPRCLNLLVSPPKCGKTSFIIGWLGQWKAGAETYINQEIIGQCPPVLLVGSDQPESDWANMLDEAGLLGQNKQLASPIIDLFTSGQPLTLDENGIDVITKYAEKNHGLLVIVDSLAACIRNLGIDENSPEVAEPISSLMEALSPYEATLIIIHHSSKAHKIGRASCRERV